MTDVLDEPSSKKPKLSSPLDFDDDPLSELEKLEPLPSILETMSQTPSSVHMPANNGPGPSSVGSTGTTSQPPSVSHGNYMGPASVIQSQAGAPAQTHNAQSQQSTPSQPSVLQELLLNPSNQNNQTLNSPRPPYTTQYQTRSPVTSSATMMTSANCPPNVALSAGPRGLRATGPQMYGPTGHTDMTMQQGGGPQLGHPTQQGSYVASQMMPPPNQQSPQSLSYAYQQSGSRPVYANTGSRAVYAAATRSAAPQAMSLTRGSAPIMLNGASAPRIRATHQGMITMQQGGGQMMRTVMVQQGSPYDQGGYAIPPQRTSDPYGISQTQARASPNYGQLTQSHMVARNQPMPYSNTPAAPPTIQQSNAMIPHMMEHSTISPQQQPNQQPTPSSLTHGNVMPQQMSTSTATMTGAPGPMSGPKSVIPPNLPPPQMQPANASATGQIQQFTGINNTAPRDGTSMSSTLPTSGAQGNNQDPGRRKLIQLQLVLLLHAHKCQQRERSADGANGRYTCTLQHCSTMKGVLQHMTTCNSGSACSYPHCPSSRQIISHWKNCVRDDCPVCTPLKSRQNVAQAVDRRTVSGAEPFGAGVGSAQQVPCGPGNATDVDNVGMQNRIATQQQQPQQQQQQPGPGTSLPPNTNSHNMSAYDSSGPTSINAFLIDFNPSNDPFRSPNPPNKLVPSLGKGSGIFITSKDIIGLPPPDAPVVKKPWQNAVTEDLRNHLVRKLVEAIFPSPDPASIHDQRIKDLVNYARKVEREMFELANDRGEYYHLLAEKIYKIQKELQEKKIKRLHEQGQAGAVAGMQPPQPVDFDMPGPPNRTTPSFQPNTSTGTQQMNGLSTSMSANAITNGQVVTSGIKVEVPDDVAVGTEPSGATDASGCCSKPGTSNATNAEKAKASVSAVKTEIKTNKVDGKGEAKVEERKELPDKVFDANELRNSMKPVLDRIYSMEESLPFRIPVDPEILGIPDYFDIVKKPMDLSTISSKLDTGDYKNPWEFSDDMWLMFDNAWLYNRKNSKVYKYCNKLSEAFVEEINPIMQRMGYCCGQKLSFTPLALFCYGQSMCTIARDQIYHVYETTSTQYGVTVSERYTYCTKCFEALPESGISLSENPNDTSNMVPKSKFVQMKNDQIDIEPFEKCIKCFRKWHRVCALFNKKVFPDGFICATCRREKNLAPAENRFTAKKLPHCQLSRFIEERVNKFMKNSPAGKDYEVIIRVLCAADKEVEVKPLMKQKYGPLGFPEKFPYRTKAIFAFEVIDGVEVCFFGLHVQEYGSNCPPPNKRRVYIAYLDSVHFFQPRQLRTEVYHEILLGYLNYAMMLGYTMAHIWACPPSEGDDYIFHCHPPEQRIPKPKRLQDWYKKMLDKGVGEHTVFDYKDIYKQARDENLVTPMELSYFEGDFWPNVIEDCIREAQNEEQERKRQEEAARQEQNAEDEDGDDIFHDGDNGKSKKNSKKKNNLKKGNSKNKKKVCSQTGNEVTDKLYINFEKHKEVFFTIRLMSPQSELSAQNNEIKDPDPLIASDLMDGRDTFLTRARDEHWEFSSLRRAKYSTICFCHALHNQEKSEGLSYTCNSCQGTAIWHCTTCEDFDLCNKCYETMSHPHKLEKVSTLVEVEDKHDASNSRTESIQRCIQSLVHACQCRDANCRRSTCHKMKRVVQHTKGCKKRQNANCAICKQLIALCCYHAKHCNGTSCQVPFCLNIRQKLQEQRRSQNRRADMMMRRRMDMLSSGYGGTNTPGHSQSSGPTGTMTISQAVTTHHGTGPMQTYQSTGMAHMQHMQMGQPQSVMPSGQQQIAQMQQLQPHQYQTHGKGGAVQGNSQIHMMGVPTTMPQGHTMSQVQQQQAPHQQGVRMNVGSQMGGMQRPAMVGQMQHTQQPMNPPPYGRGAAQQSAYGMSGTAGPSSGYGTSAGQPMMLGQSMSQNSQTQPIMQQGMQNLRAKAYTGQPIDRTALQQDPQVQAILTRFKNAERAEDKDKVLNDLKKMPHLFAAFIKMTNNERSGNDIPQSLNQQQLSAIQQQQQGMIRQPQMVTQQSGQWQQGTVSQQQYYQQQQPQVSQSGQQQPRGPSGQYASMSSQGQLGGAAMPQPQWQQQFQRNPQPVSPAMQSQFSQVRSPPIGRSPSVSNVTQSSMMQPGAAQPGVQQMQQGTVNQDQQPYR